jgi:hypothetical protein
VSAVQAVPPGAQPEESAAVVGNGLVVLKADQAATAQLVDAAGNVVGTYAADAPLTSPPPPDLQILSSIRARWLTTSGAWALVQNVYGAMPTGGGDGFQTYEVSEDSLAADRRRRQAGLEDAPDPAHRDRPGSCG